MPGQALAPAGGPKRLIFKRAVNESGPKPGRHKASLVDAARGERMGTAANGGVTGRRDPRRVGIRSLDLPSDILAKWPSPSFHTCWRRGHFRASVIRSPAMGGVTKRVALGCTNRGRRRPIATLEPPTRMSSATRKATKTLTIRLTPDQSEALRLAAEGRGIGPSTFARTAVLEATSCPVPSTRRRGNPDAQARAQLYAAVGQLCGYVRILTTQGCDGKVAAADLADLLAETAALREVVA